MTLFINLLIWLALATANFLWANFNGYPIEVAFDRSFFQAVAILVVAIIHASR